MAASLKPVTWINTGRIRGATAQPRLPAAANQPVFRPGDPDPSLTTAVRQHTSERLQHEGIQVKGSQETRGLGEGDLPRGDKMRNEDW